MTKYNYNIDTTLLPEVWVTWMSKDGRVWMNNKGKRQNKPAPWMHYNSELDINPWNSNGKYTYGINYDTVKNDRIWVASGSKVYYAYAKYHADIDRLELAIVKYDTTRREGNHEWTFAGDRMFIGKDKTILNQYGMLSYSFRPKSDDYWSMSSRDAIRIILRAHTNDFVIGEFKKLIGASYFVIGNGTSVSISYPWHITRWYKTAQKTRSNGKAQRLVDELVKMPLGEVTHLSDRYEPKSRAGYLRDEVISNIIYFERVNDEWSVLRGLVRNDNNLFDEAWRVYLGDDGTNRVASKSNGDWMPASQPKGWWFSREYYFANPDEASEKCDRIKYIMPLYEESNSIDTLITTLRFPIIEQLYKLNCKMMALRIARSSMPKSEIKEMFGGYYKEKENGVLRQLGMTKHQLDKYSALNNGHGSPSVIKKMRETFGDNLSCIDNATYDRYITAFDAMLATFWAERLIETLNVDKAKFWRNLARLGEKNYEAFRLISDTISVYNRLRDPRPDIDWLFDSHSDVVRTHDALTELYNHQAAERMALWNAQEAERLKKEDEHRKKIDKERKCYEYEDEEFIIRLPRDVQEILTEGTKQNICIGGYASRHSRGDTNLFFLRRKSAENTPFYAIEMGNNKNIVQIHGFGNRWLGNNPEAIPTVIRWLRKNDIACANEILTCTAIGYGKTADYVPMPVVD